MKTQYYPTLEVPNNPNPNKFYAIPILGFVIKIIMLIPVFIWSALVGIVVSVTAILANPFVVLLTGKYWEPALEWVTKSMTYTAKIVLFIAGITDKYPGFSLSDDGLFKLTIPNPTSPSRIFAIPLVGLLARLILLIPFFIFTSVLQYAAYIGMTFIASLSVLIYGKYPESIYEISKDSLRVQLATNTYMLGLSDNYPSFNISWNHKNIKIALLIIGTIIFLMRLLGSFSSGYSRQNQMYKYQPRENLPTYNTSQIN